jgi:UDP-4-amino-4,6-dideoxy-N-acetyl-beta-L-altrosamine transaminase
VAIPYGRQHVTEEDIAAVAAVLRSDFLTQGPTVPRFEAAVAARVGARYAVASNSATSSLHLACLALGVGPGDAVWTTPITFVASANCARYCGAEIDLVDIDPQSLAISPARLAEKLAAAEARGRLPKVVIPVHLGGQPAAMAEIGALAKRYGFRVIEDASHAIGGRYRGGPVGDGRFSDITVFSFHPVKIVTTGEGGVAVTNDETLARRMALLNSHGTTRDPAAMSGPSDGPWFYEQVALGHNYRMTDIQAALGLSQLDRLDAYVARRHALAARYDALLAGLPVATPWRDPEDYSALHLYIVRVPGGAERRRAVFEAMLAAGVRVNVHYIPLYRHPDFARCGLDPADYPEAGRYYAGAMTLPLFPTLAEADQDVVVAALREALRR